MQFGLQRLCCNFRLSSGRKRPCHHLESSLFSRSPADETWLPSLPNLVQHFFGTLKIRKGAHQETIFFFFFQGRQRRFFCWRGTDGCLWGSCLRRTNSFLRRGGG